MKDIQQEIKQGLERIERLIREKMVKPMSSKEAAKYMGVSVSYIHKLTSQRAIPFSKPKGKLLFFNPEELNKWMLGDRRSA